MATVTERRTAPDHRTTGPVHDPGARGPGLARGPALLIGAILAGFGLVLFLKNGATPTGGFPDARIDGPHVLGFETNGWTAWFTTAAGALLLLGAAEHLLAKAMSLLVGLALGACAVLSFVDGHDVLGLAAANFWTSLGWAIAAGLLLFNVLAPRPRRHADATARRGGRRLRGRERLPEQERAGTPRPPTAAA